MVNERNETMKNETNFVAGIVLALVCGGFAGCSDDVEYQLSERGGGSVVGFVDDSLVMVLDKRQWHEFRETWNSVYSEKSGYQDARLCMYNYRVQEDGPRVCDSISSDFSCSGQLADSIIWYGMFGSRSSLHLWKFGGDVRYYGLEVVNKDCKVGFDAAKAHQWFDDKFIVIGKQSLNAGGDSCQYAVLDTVGRTLVYKRFDEDLKWVEKCDDVRAWGEDVYCLLRKKENWSVLLSVDNIVVDSMEFDEERRYAVYPALFAGNMLHTGDYICSLTNKKMERKPYVKSLSDLKFINADESIVSY